MITVSGAQENVVGWPTWPATPSTRESLGELQADSDLAAALAGEAIQHPAG